MASLIGQALAIRAKGGPPVPITSRGHRRGMMFDLGSGSQSRETHLRAYTRSGTVFSIVSLLQQAPASVRWHLYQKAPQDGRRRYAPGGDEGSDQRREVTRHAAITLWDKPNEFHCLAPETRVLTRDLRWVPVGSLEVGDQIIGYDEESPEGQGARRRWRDSTVTATGRAFLPSSRVTLADGTAFTASDDHLWLSSQPVRGSYWRKTSELMSARPGWDTVPPAKVVKLLDVWDDPASYEAGYLAGMYDGEGHLTAPAKQGGLHLGIAQRDNEALFEVRAALDRLGFLVKEYVRAPRAAGKYRGNYPVHHLTMIGGGAAAGRRPAVPEVLRLLGSVRPKRLLAKWDDIGPERLGRIERLANVPVVSVEPLGLREVVTLGTSTGTFVAEGFAHHNSGFEFREGSNQHLELTGETFWVLNREVATFPTAMWYIRPDRMEPVPDPDNYLVGWIYSGPDGSQVPLKLDEVILEKLPDPLDPFRGTGPVSAVMDNIQQQDYATQYQRNLFLNGADPGGIITVPSKMSDRDFDELTERWREMHQGIARAGRVGVLENGAVWSTEGQSNKDLEYGNLRLANRDELREAWRIHKAMLGTSDDVNRANAETAEEIFARWQEIPRLERRRDTLNCKLLPMFGPGEADRHEFDFDDPTPENLEQKNAEMIAKSAAAETLISAGFEASAVLEWAGLPDMPWTKPAAPAEPDVQTDVNPGRGMSDRARETVTLALPQAKDAGAKVIAQLAKDYPPAAIAWAHHAPWSGPVNLPAGHIEPDMKWLDLASPEHVADFVEQIQAGKKLKPVILVKTPGGDKPKLIDGHHRYLADVQEDKPVRAFIGVVGTDHGPWEAMHDAQIDGRRAPANRLMPYGDAEAAAALLRRILGDGYVPVELEGALDAPRS